MPCDPAVFEDIPVFSLLDADERAVLAEQVELRRFAPDTASTGRVIPVARPISS